MRQYPVGSLIALRRGFRQFRHRDAALGDAAIQEQPAPHSNLWPLDCFGAMPLAMTARSWRLTLLAMLAVTLGVMAKAGAAERRHGLSAFGDLKYPADFKHFDYVNPDAPKGGRLATMPTSSINTFNHFNEYILRGDPAEGLALLFDSLMVRAQDEPDAVYGLIAESPNSQTIKCR